MTANNLMSFGKRNMAVLLVGTMLAGLSPEAVLAQQAAPVAPPPVTTTTATLGTIRSIEVIGAQRGGGGYRALLHHLAPRRGL